VTHDTRHLTTEELSAYLDGELTSPEQDEAERHIQSCEDCRQSLESLRQTVALLHDLPPLPLPRSFTLPVEEGSTVTPVSKHKRHLPGPLRRSLRLISGLAAVIGIFFLLSGFLTFTQQHNSVMLSSGERPASQSDSSQSAEANTPQPVTTNNKPTTPSLKKTQETTHPPQTQEPAPGFSLLSFLNLNTPGIRLGVGILLAILGGMGVTLFKPRTRGSP